MLVDSMIWVLVVLFAVCIGILSYGFIGGVSAFLLSSIFIGILHYANSHLDEDIVNKSHDSAGRGSVAGHSTSSIDDGGAAMTGAAGTMMMDHDNTYLGADDGFGGDAGSGFDDGGFSDGGCSCGDGGCCGGDGGACF